MTDRPIVFLDTETTGLHRDREVWDIGMIRREPGRPDTVDSFFVDVDLSLADPFGLQVGRFWDRHPTGLRQAARTDYAEQRVLTRGQAARQVAQYTHEAVVVGIVPSFDMETLAALLRDEALIPSWYYQPIDAEVLAAGYLRHLENTNIKAAREADPEAKFKTESLGDPPYDTEAISRALHVEVPEEGERHTAIGDALWAMRLYDAVMGR